MQDIIVTNQSVNKPGIIMTLDEFMRKATSDEGLDISGYLFIDVKVLDKDLYQSICESLDTVKFFTLNQMAPSFVDLNNVYDWSEYSVSSRHKQTAVQDATGFEDRESSSMENETISSLTGDSDTYTPLGENDVFADSEEPKKQARILLFGSSKGGTGKTFTCLINAYRYAKMNPHKRVAVSDFDIIDGQIGITIHKISPTMLDYYKKFKFGMSDFKTMEQFKTKSSNFPPNLDFYLAPRDLYIEDDAFWDSIFVNLIENYDTVFFDSGIDYMNYKPISTLYKIADKIILVSTTSIKSVSSVSKQIGRLKGTIENPVFSTEDGIADKLHLVITQAGKTDEMNGKVFATFKAQVNIVGVFGMLTSEIQKAEYYGLWNIFDKNAKFNETLDRIVQ